jgi:hypothetical protein
VVPVEASETSEDPDYISWSIPKSALRTYAREMPKPEGPDVTASVLGPRGFKQVFREIFRIYAKNSAELFSIVAIVELPIFVASYLLGLGWLIGLEPKEVASQPGRLLLTMFISAIVYVLGHLLVQGALIDGFSQQYVRARIRIGRALKVAVHRLGSLIVASIFVGLILLFVALIGVAILLALGRAGGSTSVDSLFAVLIFGAIMLFFGARLAFVPHSTVVEKASPGHAISRSWSLVRGHTLWVIVVTIIVLIMVAGITLIMQLIPIVGMVTSVLMTPLTAAGYIVLYYDLRVRKDGYTPDALAFEIGMAKGLAQASDEDLEPASSRDENASGTGDLGDDGVWPAEDEWPRDGAWPPDDERDPEIGDLEPDVE